MRLGTPVAERQEKIDRVYTLTSTRGYKIAAACREVGIAQTTRSRWLREGIQPTGALLEPNEVDQLRTRVQRLENLLRGLVLREITVNDLVRDHIRFD